MKHPGTYKLTVAYASGSNKDTNIDCRVNSVNDGDWKSISAPTTGGWTTVKKITTEVTLNRGVNVIDITGAANIPYAESNAWQQVNVDYFTLERVPEDGDLAYGKKLMYQVLRVVLMVPMQWMKMRIQDGQVKKKVTRLF